MKLYSVTLSHATGLMTILTNATDENEAIEKVCQWEKAPRSAVTMWSEGTPEQVAKWRDTLGIR